MVGRIHVVEPDVCRRARIVRDLNDLNVQTESYPDLIHLIGANPTDGCLFAADIGEGAHAIHSSGSGLPFVMYAEEPSTELVVSAMRSGALDYLRWPFEPRLLLTALEQLDADDRRRTHEQQLRAGAVATVDRLTSREKDVLRGMIEGMSNRGIAEVLGISPRTIEIHRGHMMVKLGARSTADAVRIALYSGMDREFRFAA
jgi:two-component system response regulator FixJ